jgi:hypothetical protein
MGKAGLEPARLAAHDPKSCLSANSSTSPLVGIISERVSDVNKSDIISPAFYQNVNRLSQEQTFEPHYYQRKQRERSPLI